MKTNDQLICTGRLGLNERGGSDMKEYKIVAAPTLVELERKANVYATDGWEINSAAWWVPSSTEHVVTMERERPDERNLREPA